MPSHPDRVRRNYPDGADAPPPSEQPPSHEDAPEPPVRGADPGAASAAPADKAGTRGAP